MAAVSIRQTLLSSLADRLIVLHSDQILRVAIDGVDGAGKTTFADELAPMIESRNRPVIRASVDSFHNPKSIRYRLGKDSPKGFFLDSYDYAGLASSLLDPLSPGGNGKYRSAIFDHESDSPVSAPQKVALPNSVLLFDGIFLHRPELRAYWDFSLFLDVAFDISIPRGAQRGIGSPDPQALSNRRYVEGQKLYLSQCQPKRHASVVIDHNDLSSPRITRD